MSRLLHGEATNKIKKENHTNAKNRERNFTIFEISDQLLRKYFGEETWDRVRSRRWNMTNSGSWRKNGYLTYRLDGSGVNLREQVRIIRNSGIEAIIRNGVTLTDSNGITSPAIRDMVRDAFELYEKTTGIDFRDVTGNRRSRIDFDMMDEKHVCAGDGCNSIDLDRAYTKSNVKKQKGPNRTRNVDIVLGQNRINNPSSLEHFSTIIHEIGHAMGLGHSGNYNGTVENSSQIVARNDSTSLSIQSYINPKPTNWRFYRENNVLGGALSVDVMTDDYSRVAITPQVADFRAIDRNYWNTNRRFKFGTSKAFPGDTTYGFNGTITGTIYDQLSTLLVPQRNKLRARDEDGNILSPLRWIKDDSGNDYWFTWQNEMTLADGDGEDTLDLSLTSENQRINLNPSKDFTFETSNSDVLGGTKNLHIAVGTIIENAKSGSGNDKIEGNDVNNKLWGGDGNDELFGNEGEDELDGQVGEDIMRGGPGNDIYFVDNRRDFVLENRNEGDEDMIKLQITDGFLPRHVEDIEGIDGTLEYNIRGNELNNNITGNINNDTLDGGFGTDTLRGGLGNDTYYNRANNTIIESINQGDDTLWTSRGVTLQNNIENAVFRNLPNERIVASPMNGNSANNHLSIIVNQSIELNGLEGDDTLIGFNRNDRLDGGLGADSMEGGNGNDTYHIDNTGDQVLDSAGVRDTIISNLISTNLQRYPGIENLNLMNGAMHARGTNDENKIEGNTNANFLIGLDGNDTLRGHEGNDILNGGGGADRLEGWTGNDTYIVDNINDIIIEEGGVDDIDTVNSFISYELDKDRIDPNSGECHLIGGTVICGGESIARLENLNLKGNSNVNGTGNINNNKIVGNSGNNILSGEEGNDQLTGGRGKDTLTGGADADEFIFKNTNDSSRFLANADVITDFSNSDGDIIDLSNIDANVNAIGDQSFVRRNLTGLSLLAPPAGTMLINSNTGTISLYTDSIIGVDMFIKVEGDVPLSSNIVR